MDDHWAMIQEPSKMELYYPINPALKHTYQALILLVLQKKRILFTIEELYSGMFEITGLVNDGNISSPETASGANYKRFKQHLKSLTGTLIKSVSGGFEVYVFEKYGKRITTFAVLEEACAEDKEMSEFVTGCIKFDMDQDWQDKKITEKQEMELPDLSIFDQKNFIIVDKTRSRTVYTRTRTKESDEESETVEV